MDGAATDEAAFDETVVFLSHFKGLADPRVRGAKVWAVRRVGAAL